MSDKDVPVAVENPRVGMVAFVEVSVVSDKDVPVAVEKERVVTGLTFGARGASSPETTSQ